MEYLTVMLGRVSPLGVEVDAVVVRIPSHVIPVRKGCHRQWRRHRHARSLVSDTEYLLHRLLALRLDKLPRLICHRRSDARKCESAVRRARPGSPRMFEPLVELVVPHIVAGVCGPTGPGLRRVFALPVPAAVGCLFQGKREEGIYIYTFVRRGNLR